MNLNLKAVSRSALLLALVSSAVGCASVQRAPPERDAEVKTFKAPAANKANLYVFRDETFGSINKLSVLLDSKIIGDTQGHTFVFTEVDPGPHKLMSKAENDFELPFTAEAGKSVFVWQEVKMGAFSARSKLHLVDEARGKQGVAACELVAPPGTPAPAQ